MTKHYRSSALAGASLLALAPERKEDDPAALGLEVKKGFEDFNRAFAEFKTKNDERLKQVEKKGEDAVTKTEIEKLNQVLDGLKSDLANKIKKRVDEIEAKANRMALGGGGLGGKQQTQEQKEYGEKFDQYFRGGEDLVRKSELRDLERKAASANSEIDPSGGFTVRPEIDEQIDSVLKEISPVRSVATVRTIGTSSLKRLVNQHGTTSGWVGERESRPQTLAPDLVELEFPVFEIFAMPAASQQLLDDSTIDIGQWLVDEVELEFAQQEGRAFIAGDGVKKPRGIIGGYPIVADANYAWGNLGYVATGASGAFASSNPADALIDLIFTLKSAYRPNGTFLFNRKTMAAIRKLKDGQGNYLVDLRLRDGALVETIFGYPALEVEGMPDIAANSISAAFGDFRRGYTVVDRVGTRVLRDPYTSKPYVLFYTTKRVGGGVSNFEAIKLLKFAAS